MIKELFITLYLFAVRITFTLFKLLPLKNKTVFLSTFGDNAYYLAQQLTASSNQELVFLNKARCKIDFSTLPGNPERIYSFEPKNLKDFIISIYHLATAKYLFIDNYYGELAAMDFRNETKCVQLWHAIGAIKKFGWADPETLTRKGRSQKRFQQVYNKFQYIPVNSRQMASIFTDALHLEENRFLFTGVPQTDFYFDPVRVAESKAKVLAAYPEIQGKTVILYAPTYRKDAQDHAGIELDVDLMLEKLDERYLLLIRLHPSIKNTLESAGNPRVILANDYPSVNELLLVTDILITDYSSIPFEFSLLRKKMIFFTYDMERYSRTNGLWAVNDLYFPGPFATSTSEVLDHIIDPVVDLERIDRFQKHWNTFANGNSTSSLIHAIYDTQDL
ncbi:MAG TPA: CDP-glycerol glycerophosphotransferase family protein [Planococcus sp. (in: firmicutes)]|nr:CDP-glycerol glycerophosphotransferase family protein [Planococcus sp. (in: firmicutes)]